ncbi:MAG: DUF3540 domain-containing protein [Myxococcota bacterium]
MLRCVDRGCLVALEPAPSGRAPSGRAPSEQGDEAPLWTRRAASCLLVPRPGDRVLMTRAPEPFVLAVLERNDAHTEPATLEVEGDMRVRSRGGQLELEGDAGVSVQTRATLELTGRALKVRSEAAEVATEALTAVVRRFRGRLDEAGLVTRTLDTVVERVTQKAARVYRTVTELDQLRARHFDHRADHSARISADNTVVTARQVVKVDGEQVHIG